VEESKKVDEMVGEESSLHQHSYESLSNLLHSLHQDLATQIEKEKQEREE